MLPIVAALNFWMSLGIIAMQGAIVLIAIALFFPTNSIAVSTRNLLKRFAIPLGFFVALAGTFLTLLYSDYFGFIPCGLCWLERIALYPQVVLLGIAWFKKDNAVWKYVLALSLAGLIVALYHHYIQIGGADLIPCPASGNGDCGKRIIYEFGYMTFPLMAATLFAWQALLSFVATRR